MKIARALLGAMAAVTVAACAPARPAAEPVDVDAANGNPFPGRGLSQAEQLIRGWFDYDRLSDSIPGFGGYTEESCTAVVYLTNPARDSERAREVLRPALARGRAGECVKTLDVVAIRSSWREMRHLLEAVSTRLAEWQLRPRGGVGIQLDRIVIHAHNQRTLTAIRERLAADSLLRRADIVVALLPGPQELDGPIHPPAAAYLAVLDSVAASIRRAERPGRVVVDSAGLPGEVLPSDLLARGFAPMDSTYRCGIDPRIRFDDPRQFEDGRYQLTTVEWLIPQTSSMSSDFIYDVVCKDGTCRVTAVMFGVGDRLDLCRAAPPG